MQFHILMENGLKKPDFFFFSKNNFTLKVLSKKKKKKSSRPLFDTISVPALVDPSSRWSTGTRKMHFSGPKAKNKNITNLFFFFHHNSLHKTFAPNAFKLAKVPRNDAASVWCICREIKTLLLKSLSWALHCSHLLLWLLVIKWVQTYLITGLSASIYILEDEFMTLCVCVWERVKKREFEWAVWTVLPEALAK